MKRVKNIRVKGPAPDTARMARAGTVAKQILYTLFLQKDFSKT
jgi:hypothetical protein